MLYPNHIGPPSTRPAGGAEGGSLAYRFLDKFQFLAKISIFGQKSKFWLKIEFFQKFKFWPKIALGAHFGLGVTPPNPEFWWGGGCTHMYRTNLQRHQPIIHTLHIIYQQMRHPPGYQTSTSYQIYYSTV
jgi:hypothetical protein